MASNKLNKRVGKINSDKSMNLKGYRDYGMFYEIEHMTDRRYGSRILRIIYGIDGTSDFVGILKTPLPFKK